MGRRDRGPRETETAIATERQQAARKNNKERESEADRDSNLETTRGRQTDSKEATEERERAAGRTAVEGQATDRREIAGYLILMCEKMNDPSASILFLDAGIDDYAKPIPNRESKSGVVFGIEIDLYSVDDKGEGAQAAVQSVRHIRPSVFKPKEMALMKHEVAARPVATLQPRRVADWRRMNTP